ncbi:MAG: energy-coupling factor transporter transmembrane component T family protein [Thermacetogeniaceae bacterium]
MYKPGCYLQGESCLHRMHPLAKISAVVALSIVTFRAGASGLMAITCFLIATSLVSQVGFKRILQALRPALPFFALLFLMHLVSTGGRPLTPSLAGKVSITYEGLQQGALLVWRFLLLVLSSTLLTMVTSPSELIAGIRMLLKPWSLFGISPDDLAILLSLALRFLPTLLEESERMREARLARGADFSKGSVLQKTKAVASIAIPLTLSAFRRAEDLATAMESRGYRRGPRTYLNEKKMQPLDYLITGAAAITGAYFLFFS